MNNVNHTVPVILIVDDNPSNLQILGKLLHDEKYDVEFAVSGEATLEWLKIRRFDLVLLDLNMPGMNGFEVCRIIRAKEELINMPIIFLSAESERESILKGFELGAQDFVTKPFDNRELLARVKTQIDLKQKSEKLEKVNEWLAKKIDHWLKISMKKPESGGPADLNDKLIEFDKSESIILKDINVELLASITELQELISKCSDKKTASQCSELLKRMLEMTEKISSL